MVTIRLRLLSSRIKSYGSSVKLWNQGSAFVPCLFGCLGMFKVQAVLVGLLAAIIAVLLGWVTEGHFDTEHALLLCCSSIFTVGIASGIQGMLIC